MGSAERINLQHLKLYLKILYKVNNRKSKSLSSKKNDTSNGVLIQMFAAVFIGIPMVFVFVGMNNFPLAIFSCFTLIMTLLLLNFINESSDVLFNTNESNILFHRPINDRTVFAGRLIYLLLYALVFGLAISLIPLVYLLIVDGFGMFLGFLLGAISTVFFAVSLSAFLYMVLVKAFGGEKFKKIVFIIQAVISVGIIMAVNLDRTLLENIDFSSIDFLSEYWVLALPPAWEYGFVALVSGEDMSLNNMVLSALGILVPVGLSFITYRYLSASFKSDMIGFEKKTNVRVRKKRFALENFFAAIFTRGIQESGIFKTVFKILLRERDFMMKMYSTSAVFLSIAAMNIYKIMAGESGFDEKNANFVLVIMLYSLSLMFILSADRFSVGKYSEVIDKYKAAPIVKPGVISVATVKALYSIFFIPAFAVLSLIIGYVWGISSILNVVAVFFAANIIVKISCFSGKKKFPLSLGKAEGQKLVAGIMGFVLTILFATFHIGLNLLPWGLLSYTLVLGIIYFVIMKKMRAIEWGEFM